MKLPFTYQEVVLGIIVMILPNISVRANQMDIGIKNFTKADYQADYQNWSVSIGPDNYVYVANNSGLLVYDGVSWDFYTNPVINNIRAVKVDSVSGRIYTAGYREMGYWQWDSFGMLHYTSLNSTVEAQFTKNEEFWDIVITPDSVIFQSFTGLFIYSNGEMELIRPYEFINSISSPFSSLIKTLTSFLITFDPLCFVSIVKILPGSLPDL